MLELTPKVGILGTGAIGATLIAALHRRNVPIDILVRSEVRRDELLKDGIRYRFKSKRTTVMPGKTTRIVLVPGDGMAGAGGYDYIFLGVKTPHLAESVPKAARNLSKTGKVVCLQNGLPEAMAAAHIEAERVVGGVVGWNVQTLEGEYYQSNPGDLVLGPYRGSVLPSDLAAMFGHELPVRVTNNLAGYRWHKLGINSVINGLGAVSGLTVGGLLSTKTGRAAALGMIEEARSVADANGVKEEVMSGSISFRKFGRHGSWPLFLQHAILMLLGKKYARVRTSMLQDIEAHRPTEVGELNGTVVSEALKIGIPSPMNQTAVELVRAIEAGKGRPDVRNLDRIVASVSRLQ